MKTIFMKNGCVKYPDNWVAVKNMEPAECDYCGVVEVRNGHKYNCPKFIFFLDHPVVNLTEEDEYKINKAIIDRCPDFQDIIDDHVKEEYDENYHLLNPKEWDEAPTIGHFSIEEKGKPALVTDAYICRDE